MNLLNMENHHRDLLRRLCGLPEDASFGNRLNRARLKRWARDNCEFVLMDRIPGNMQMWKITDVTGRIIRCDILLLEPLP